MNIMNIRTWILAYLIKAAFGLRIENLKVLDYMISNMKECG